MRKSVNYLKGNVGILKKSSHYLKRFFVTALIIGSVVPESVFAEVYGENDDFGQLYDYAVLSDGTAEIRQVYSYWLGGGAEDTVIPEEIDGYTVTSIGYLANANNIKHITLPDTITNIGDYAFLNCANLQSINLPDSISSVGANPFKGVEEDITFTISHDHPYLSVIDGVLFSKPDKRLIYMDGYSYYVVPDGVEIIGADSCNNDKYYGLRGITLPDSVTTIEDNAFPSHYMTAWAYGIDINFPDSITSVGARPFGGSIYEDNITISPDHPYLKYVEAEDFHGYNSALISRPDSRFICIFNGHDEYEVPEDVTTIEEYAFAGQDYLHSVIIPDSVKSIGKHAFEESGVEYVDLPEGLTTIADYMFASCKHIKEFTVPDSVTSIGQEAFSGCPLNRVTIPAGVTSIGEDAFGSNSDSILFIVEHDSYAEQYCKENGFNYQYTDAASWLSE